MYCKEWDKWGGIMRQFLFGFALTLLSGSVLAQEFKSLPDHYPAQSLVESFGGEALGAAEISAIRPLTATSLELIADFEGWEPRAYNDAVGYCTIGYGHLIALKSCRSIELGEFSSELSMEAGLKLLEEDTAKARLAVLRQVKVDMTDEQFGAVTSFVFNVGAGNFGKSTLLRLLNDEQPDLAVKQFGRWVSARGRVLPGLVARRSCEAALFDGRTVTGGNGRFNRGLCDSLGAAPDVGPVIDIYEGE
jgi:lysozyme